MTSSADRRDLITVFSKAFLVGVKRGESDSARLFARAFLVSRFKNGN
jgi:hypothetical protein